MKMRSLTWQNPPLKSCQCIKKFYTIIKGFRSFNAKNLGSVSQRVSKLLADKVGVLKKKSAALAIPPELCASAFGPELSSPEVESNPKFDSQ